MRNSIDRHMELHLGPIVHGWKCTTDHADLQVCLFDDRPVAGVVTYATLGLSRHVLAMPHGREVRQELLLSVASRFAGEHLPKLLAYVGDGVLREHRALLRGQVLPLSHPISGTSRCASLYVALPVVFPDGLATSSDTAPPTVFAWLVPLHPAESDLVGRLGWSTLEDRLEKADPDLFDLERGAVA